MKKLLILLLTVAFLVTSPKINGISLRGSINNIIVAKTGGVELQFDLPKEYTLTNDNLSNTLNISISQTGKAPVFSQQTRVNSIILPELGLPVGVYFVHANIADYSTISRITIKKG